MPGISFGGAVDAMEKLKCLIAALDITQSVPVTCSFGVTHYIPGDSIDAIYKRADVALYRAKHAGRNRVMGY